jgi:Family of unknown function (DUF5678)
MSSTGVAPSPLPEGAAEQYAGKWIAIRDEEVIADADTLEDLTADERVTDKDVLYRVPDQGVYFY